MRRLRFRGDLLPVAAQVGSDGTEAHLASPPNCEGRSHGQAKELCSVANFSSRKKKKQGVFLPTWLTGSILLGPCPGMMTWSAFLACIEKDGRPSLPSTGMGKHTPPHVGKLVSLELGVRVWG